MNRLGISPSDVPCFARTLADCPHLELEGIFTHFASSEVFTDEETSGSEMYSRACWSICARWELRRR